MSGVHDLGGTTGFGPVVVEADEPVFHAEWEGRALGLTLASVRAGVSNTSQFRHSMERMEPNHYLESPYYEHWITGIATRFVETGHIPGDELDERVGGSFGLSAPAWIDEPDVVVAEGDATQRFAAGDRVRVRGGSVLGHTRCPRYIHGRIGTIVRIDAPSSLPDIEAHSADRRFETIYAVRFEATELWPDGDERVAVHVDLWDSYLEPAG